jgi:hypothetical protein
MQVISSSRFRWSASQSSTSKFIPENSIGSLLYNAINMPPILPPYDENGNYTRALDLGNEVVNPVM